jgi:hypothetical protein
MFEFDEGLHDELRAENLLEESLLQETYPNLEEEVLLLQEEEEKRGDVFPPF